MKKFSKQEIYDISGMLIVYTHQFMDDFIDGNSSDNENFNDPLFVMDCTCLVTNLYSKLVDNKLDQLTSDNISLLHLIITSFLNMSNNMISKGYATDDIYAHVADIKKLIKKTEDIAKEHNLDYTLNH